MLMRRTLLPEKSRADRIIPQVPTFVGRYLGRQRTGIGRNTGRFRLLVVHVAHMDAQNEATSPLGSGLVKCMGRGTYSGWWESSGWQRGY